MIYAEKSDDKIKYKKLCDFILTYSASRKFIAYKKINHNWYFEAIPEILVLKGCCM